MCKGSGKKIRADRKVGGFSKGVQKGTLFLHQFLHRFWGGFGVIFWIKNRRFSTFFGIHFLAMTFHVIMLVLEPVCVPLDVPK